MTDADKKLYDKAVDDLWSIASGTPEEIDAMTTPWIAGYRKGIEDMKKEACEFAILNTAILKLRNCENCKYHSFWGDELKCNYGLKEALQEDKLVECHNLDKWEMKECY